MTRREPEAPDPASTPRRRAFDQGDVVAALIGAGLGWAGIGFTQQFGRVLDLSPATQYLAWSAVLCGLAVGPALPPALALWIARRGLNRRRAKRDPWPAFAADGAMDLALYWTVLGASALVAGVALTLGPFLLATVGRGYAYLLRHFFWSAGSLRVVEALSVFGLAMILFPPIGWTMGCAHGLADPATRWSVRSLAWTLIGAAVAGFASAAMVGWRLPPPLMTVVSAVPFFAVAILAVRCSHQHDRFDEPPAGGTVAPPPVARDRWPVVLRAAVVATVLAGAAGGVWWTRAFTVIGRLDRTGAWMVLSFVVLAFGGGVLVERGSSRLTTESIGGFATRCIAAGTVTAVALAAAALLPWGVNRVPGPWLLGVMVGTCAGGPAFAAGCATAYGQCAVICRGGSRVATGSSLLSLCLFALGVMTLVVIGPAVAWLGSYACIVAAALTLLAVGGVLIIHEPAFPAYDRRVRLAIVFGVVILMAVTLPWPSRTWLQTRSGPRVRLIETQWLTLSQWLDEERLMTRVEPPPRRPVDPERFIQAALGDPPTGSGDAAGADAHGPLLRFTAIPPNRSAAFVGHTSEALRSAVGLIDAACPRYPFDMDMPGPYDRPGEASSKVPYSGTYLMRLQRGRLDLVVLSLDGVPRVGRENLLAGRVLARVRDTLTPDGLAVLLLPLALFEPRELDRWVDRVGDLTDNAFLWTCLPGRDATVLVLAFGHQGGAWPSRWSRWSDYTLRPPHELPGAGPAH